MSEYIVALLFKFDHPKHGMYYVWHDQHMDTYGITQSEAPPWCAYASLAEVFKLKGL